MHFSSKFNFYLTCFKDFLFKFNNFLLLFVKADSMLLSGHNKLSTGLGSYAHHADMLSALLREVNGTCEQGGSGTLVCEAAAE